MLHHADAIMTVGKIKSAKKEKIYLKSFVGKKRIH